MSCSSTSHQPEPEPLNTQRNAPPAPTYGNARSDRLRPTDTPPCTAVPSRQSKTTDPLTGASYLMRPKPGNYSVQPASNGPCRVNTGYAREEPSLANEHTLRPSLMTAPYETG